MLGDAHLRENELCSLLGTLIWKALSKGLGGCSVGIVSPHDTRRSVVVVMRHNANKMCYEVECHRIILARCLYHRCMRNCKYIHQDS